MDLVIDDEKIMIEFLKLLVHYMNTIDGRKDSGIGIKKVLLKQKKKDYFRKYNSIPS